MKLNKKQIPTDIGSLITNYPVLETPPDNLHIAVIGSENPAAESLSVIEASLVDISNLGGGGAPEDVSDVDAAALLSTINSTDPETPAVQIAFSMGPGEELKTMSFKAHAALLDNYWGLSAALDAINGE